MNSEHSSPCRILHIIPHDGIGGVEVAARSMADRCDLPCDFRLLLIAGRTLSKHSARIVESPFKAPLNPLAQVRALWIAVRARPDIVITSLWRSVPLLLVLRFIRPQIRAVFFLNAEKPCHLIDQLCASCAIYNADEVWADSYRTLETRLCGRRTAGRVISFVTERLSPAGRSAAVARPRFVSWCRISSDKGIDQAIHFIRELHSRGIQAKLEVWGPDDGSLQDLKDLTRKMRLERYISFAGIATREELIPIAGRSSFFILLSHTEGMAMSVVEAMQLGLVPVVTAVGEIRNYVKNGETGIIFDPEDPNAAARAVVEMLGDSNAFARMRERIIAVWSTSPLYADEVCRAAQELVSGSKATAD